MPNRLPSDFDPDWYSATYPDVALSGLNPHDHYRLFGRMLRRHYKAPPAAAPPASSPSPAPTLEEFSSSKRQAGAISSIESNRAPVGTIVDRPEGFDPSAGVPTPAPVKSSKRANSIFSLDEIAPDGESGRSLSAVAEAARAYAALCSVKTPSGLAESQARRSCGASAFQTGGTRIEKAWLVTPSHLRLRLSLVAEGGVAAPSDRLVLRAYQALPDLPSDLRMLGNGIQLPPAGPVFHDFELLHPLMPLLLELSDAGGSTSALTLVPFPSLLPGGLHGGELKALQTEANPMDDFWAQSDALLQEALGGENWPQRVVTHVAFTGEDGTSDWQAIQSAVKEWIGAVFGVSFEEIGTSRAGAHQLIVAANSVPTVSALVSRRLQSVTDGALVGSYLVVDAENYRPRWLITLPADSDAENVMPRLQGITTAEDRPRRVESARLPLAIVIRAPNAKTLGEPAPERPSRSSGPLSVLVYASDASRAERLIRSLRTVVGEEIDLLVSHDDADGDLRAAVDRACGAHAWTKLSEFADHRHVAKNVQHEVLLTVSDRVELDTSGGALPAVVDLLRGHETAASASCALLAEKIVKNEVVLQPASAGIFPTGASFVGAPALTFGEPDLLDALPDLSYPVVANTLLFTVWRRSLLAQLPNRPAMGPTSAEDIRTGLDLMRAGYNNWCTTKVTARLSGAYVPRDQIDPLGPGYLQPDRWEDVLSPVSIVRELL